MKKIIVLGAGLVGKAIAADLADDYAVTSVDISVANLQRVKEKAPNVTTVQADVSKKQELVKQIADADLVVGAVPGFMGFEMMKNVLEAGKNIADISFFNEDPFLLDEIAKSNGVTAVMDCGVAPGLDNIFFGYHNKKMKVNSFECLVGGLPKERRWPYEYKAPFSPIDVIAEYTRPARFVKDGKVVVKPALTDPELIDFQGIGTLEVFNTDGLRTLIKTMKHVPNMIERTMRFPGHIELMRVLRETGFFNEEPITVKDKEIRPIDLTAQLLFPKWKLGDNDHEFTVMRVTIKGEEKEFVYDLYDEYDEETSTSSMARTTGYTCTAAARLIAEGRYSCKGVIAPEFLGEDEEAFGFIINYLKERKIKISLKEKTASGEYTSLL